MKQRKKQQAEEEKAAAEAKPAGNFFGQEGFVYNTVSYTHLTLPTIYSV